MVQSYRNMHKKTVRDIDLVGKKVLVRVDYNTPLSKEGVVQNDKRIRATLSTIQYLLEQSSKIILITHVGRPKGEVVENLRTTDIARVLSSLIERPVIKLDECIGDKVEEAVERMQPGDIVLLENVRFHSEEKKNDQEFSRKLASLADVFVNDGFGVSHREQSSVTGVTKFLPSVAGLLVEKEFQMLTSVRDNPKEPLVVVMGGVKLETRIPMIEQFIQKADKILFGGAMIFTFYKAQGKEVGTSLVDEAFVETAKELLEKYPDKLILPTDVVVADSFDNPGQEHIVAVDAIPEDKIGLDVGPETVHYFAEQCENAKTLIWNGPLGAFEILPFNEGTEHFAKEVVKHDVFTVIGGGDTASALERAGIAKEMDFVSTGGGASLTLLEGKNLPGIESLDDK